MGEGGWDSVGGKKGGTHEAGEWWREGEGGEGKAARPSITSLFTDFSAGRHVDICNYRTEARGRRSFYIRDPNDDF